MYDLTPIGFDQDEVWKGTWHSIRQSFYEKRQLEKINE